ncbi:YihY/virulence factor BrkB family protein [Thermoproteota archaeon]
MKQQMTPSPLFSGRRHGLDYVTYLIRCLFKALHDQYIKNMDYLSAAISFFALISIIPLIIVLTIILSFLSIDITVFLEPLKNIFPHSNELFNRSLLILSTSRKWYGIVGFLLGYYAATNLFRILHKALFVIFEIPLREHRRNIKIQLFSIPIFIMGLFSIYVFTHILSFSLDLLLRIQVLEQIFLKIPFEKTFLNISNIINFLTFFLFIMLIYDVLAPRLHKRFRNTFVITSLVSIVLIALKNSFNALVIHITVSNPIYGTFGSIFGFLAWIFLTFNIILIGARTIYYLEKE